MKRRENRRKRERENLPPVIDALLTLVKDKDPQNFLASTYGTAETSATAASAPSSSSLSAADAAPSAPEDNTANAPPPPPPLPPPPPSSGEGDVVIEGAGLERLVRDLGPEACARGGAADVCYAARRVPHSRSTPERVLVSELAFALSLFSAPADVFAKRQAVERGAALVDDTNPMIHYYKGTRFNAIVRALDPSSPGARQSEASPELAAEWEAFMRSVRTPLPMSIRVHQNEPFLRKEARDFLGGARPLPRLRSSADATSAAASAASAAVSPNANADGEAEQTNTVVTPVPCLPPELEMFSCSHADYHSHKRVEYLCRTLHSANAVSFQEVVSALPVLVLDARPGHSVLDMCAAPGSKTLQALDAVLGGGWGAGANNGVLVASEKDRTKATQTLPARLKRYHAPNVMTTRCDGTQWPQLYERTGPGQWARERRFDRIICDVPCSGDGTVRKEPSVASTWSAGYVRSLVPTQKALLRRGLDLLAAGGVLVYSTCSMNPKEDEEVVCAGLELFGDRVELLDVNEVLRAKGATLHSAGGILEPNVEELRHKVVPAGYDGRKVLRVLPHRDNTGGFFVAAFRKRSLVSETAAAASASTAAATSTAAVPLTPAEVSRKLNQWTKGKLWSAVRRDDPVWQGILDFYGLDGDSPHNFFYAAGGEEGESEEREARRDTVGGGGGLSVAARDASPSSVGLVPIYHLNPHGGPTRRIVLATPALAAMLLETRPYKGPGVEVVSVGVRAFEAYDGKFLSGAECRWRAVVESATFLAPRAARRKLLLSRDRHTALMRQLLAAGSVALWGEEHWRALLGEECARLNAPRHDGHRFPFVKPGTPLAAALAGEAELAAEELQTTAYQHVEVGPVLLGLAHRHTDADADAGEMSTSTTPPPLWFVSATLSGGKLELAIDASLRTFGLLCFFGEQPEQQQQHQSRGAGEEEAVIAERNLQ